MIASQLQTAEEVVEDLLARCKNSPRYVYTVGETKPRRRRWARKYKCGEIISNKYGKSQRLLCDTHADFLFLSIIEPKLCIGSWQILVAPD